MTVQGTSVEGDDSGSSLVGTTGPMEERGKSFLNMDGEHLGGDFVPPLFFTPWQWDVLRWGGR